MSKAAPPETVIRIVRWAVLIFLAYALVSGGYLGQNHNKKADEEKAARIAAQPAPEKDCTKENNPLSSFSALAGVIMPSTVPTILVEDLNPGKGDRAMCGQHVTLRYQYELENGDILFSSIKGGEPEHAVIGDGSLLHGLELGLMGMKPGGERKISFPPEFGFGTVKDMHALKDSDRFTLPGQKDISRSVIVATAQLIDASPAIADSTLPLRVITRRFSGGTTSQCGDNVTLELTIWKMDGTKLFSTTDQGHPLSFRIGTSPLPYGIEQAVIGMAQGGQRTVIIPPAFSASLNPASPDSADASFPASLPQEALLAEVQMLKVGEPAAMSAPQNPAGAATPAPDAAGDKSKPATNP